MLLTVAERCEILSLRIVLLPIRRRDNLFSQQEHILQRFRIAQRASLPDPPLKGIRIHGRLRSVAILLVAGKRLGREDEYIALTPNIAYPDQDTRLGEQRQLLCKGEIQTETLRNGAPIASFVTYLKTLFQSDGGSRATETSRGMRSCSNSSPACTMGSA